RLPGLPTRLETRLRTLWRVLALSSPARSGGTMVQMVGFSLVAVSGDGYDADDGVAGDGAVACSSALSSSSSEGEKEDDVNVIAVVSDGTHGQITGVTEAVEEAIEGVKAAVAGVADAGTDVV